MNAELVVINIWSAWRGSMWCEEPRLILQTDVSSELIADVRLERDILEYQLGHVVTIEECPT